MPHSFVQNSRLCQSGSFSQNGGHLEWGRSRGFNIPPYRETGVATPLSHCVSCGIADYRCHTPTFCGKNGRRSQSKDRPNKEASQKKLASEAYRAIGGAHKIVSSIALQWDTKANRALSGPLRLRVQSRSRTRLRIAASIAFLFRACFKGGLDTIAPLSRG